jgi:hypothetical protein
MTDVPLTIGPHAEYPPQEQGWEPIETAPYHETVFVWIPGYGQTLGVVRPSPWSISLRDVPAIWSDKLNDGVPTKASHWRAGAPQPPLPPGGVRS